jgi:outer membrane receptor protein involved in Fe transport
MDLSALLLSVALRVADVQRPRIAEAVTVTGVAPSIAAPSAVTVLGRDELAGTPSMAIDDALRSVPGFSLFRRSSSRVANPTTQGVTLRGLAASGSSRALVLADDVPLNDPVGGWIYWNRVPLMALNEVAVARGAAGDLHGADSMAGVVSLRGLQSKAVRLMAEAGSDETARGSGYAGWNAGEIGLFASGEAFATEGFIIAAPEVRGPIDTPAASRYATVHGALSGTFGGAQGLVRASHFAESRRNGTPIQRNSTRATQVSGNLAARSGWSARAYALTQTYEQTFSAIADARTSERQTSEQQVEAAAVGAAADWAWSDAGRALLLSASSRFVDANLEQTAFTAAGIRLTPDVTTPQQVTAAIAAQGRIHGARTAVGGGIRGELWRSSFEESNRQIFFSPRLWATYAATGALTVRVAFQSGHRGPTINELYRPFRVGNVITEANPLLDPESARGVEAGASWHRRGHTLRALGFWSRVDDAIVNVTLSSGGATIIRQRRNAARITARGMEIEAEIRATRSLMLTGSTAFIDSTFAAGPLEGLRVPQVPRWHHAIGARAVFDRLRLSAEWRYIGRQFDDDVNAFVLDRSTMTDVRAGWMVRRNVEIFGAIENVLDEEQDVGRTPLRTIGLPRTSRVGVRVIFD